MSATLLFPLAAILVSVFSILQPEYLSSVKSAIVPLLGVVMLGMGMTLRPENFIEVLKRPKLVAVGVTLQFVLMPLIAFSVSHLFGLSAELVVGMVLLGSCPGGTASNVICYLARGDVALSISLTTFSTMLAFVFTPLLTWVYVGETVEVPVLDMMLNIFRIIILPVAAGVLVNHYLGNYIRSVKHIFPFISAFSIVLIIGIIVSLNHSQLALIALPVVAAIFWHNGIGLLSGYYLSRFLGFNERQCRAIAIEVGMQNSGLAVALAQTYFQAVTALPGAMFSIWHNITGSILSGYWSRKDKSKERLA